jgi:hypothetical protein
MTEDGRPIYRDGSHLRPFYVREHASFIDQALQVRGVGGPAQNDAKRTGTKAFR